MKVITLLESLPKDKLFNEILKDLDKKLEEIKERENISVFQICFGKDGCD